MNNRNTPVERLTDKELHDRIITIIANDMISDRESEELRELLARWDAAERMLIKFILSEFREEWIRGHRADPDIYPEELDSSSEWIEQFFIWIDDYD